MLWSERVAAALELPAWSSEESAVLLDLARDIAHGTERRFAPLTAYALGLAVGRTGTAGQPGAERLPELERLAAAIRDAVAAAVEDAAGDADGDA